MTAILLIGSGERRYREYLCAAIARAHRVILVESGAPTWELRHVADWVRADLDDADAVLEAVRGLDVDGVLTYDERRVQLAAEVAAELGLAHLSVGAAGRCRDKLATRRALARAGVPQARAHHVFSISEAQWAAQDVGFPLIVKPRALSGSVGVVRVDGPAGLPGALELARSFGSLDGVLVEEYLCGPEISVDSVVLGGHVEPVTMAHKRLGFAPYFEEVGHIVSGARVPDDVRAVVLAAHRALGVERGVTHTELRLTSTGPRVVEVNARLGADLIPYLGWLASGVDLARAAAAVAVGRWPELTQTRSGAAGVRFFYPQATGRVRALEVSGELPEYVERLEFEVAPGASVALPPEGFLSRLGFAVVVGENERECEARLDAVERRLRMVLEPLACA